MNTMNQNKILTSLEDALVPAPYLVDGRTELDWLSFIADFASLINFYDTNNKVNGSWAPFLLKDPVILLATISKTNVSKIHALYLQTSTHIERTIESNDPKIDVAYLFNSLFEQLLRLFAKLERWIYFMQKSNQEYSLKNYLLYQIETIYSPILWALLALRQQFFVNKIIADIDVTQSSIFEKADPKIWRKNKDKKPYWEILNLNKSFLSNKTEDFLNALKNIGDQLFLFFNTVVQYAKFAFENLKEKRGQFPDTILMRTFVSLLMNYKEQLNEISQKHLDFYYTDILKQKIRNALPDSVYIAIELGKKNLSFLLPKGTSFDAGTDAQKNPITFSSVEKVSLNPATVVSAKTITSQSFQNSPKKLYSNFIATPSVVQKDEIGKIQGWPIFGDGTAPSSAPIALGFAIASPLLLVREGSRNIQFTLTFEKEGALTFLNSAKYYLSTQAAWLPVLFDIAIVDNATQSILLNVTLDSKQPPIEAFAQNPDGYTSLWPLLKIEFDSVDNNDAVPVLKTVRITVSVNNVTSLLLNNDYGALDPKNPFQLFGPTPHCDSNFIIGSNEIFSKPVQSLDIDMTWDKLPTDFQSYYQEYNNYLAFLDGKTVPEKQLVQIEDKTRGIQKIIGSIVQASVKVVKGIVQKAKDLILQLLKEILDLLRAILDIQIPDAKVPFNNIYFIVDFELLSNNSWIKIDMEKQGVAVAQDGTITAVPYTVNENCNPEAAAVNNLLFSTNNTSGLCQLTNKSFFSYNIAEPIVPLDNKNTPTILGIDFVKVDTETKKEPVTSSLSNVNPYIQQTPLVYTDQSTTGFIKMVLKEPTSYGFGFELYPEVVANIALQNALLISKDPKIDPKKLLSPAKLPFAPKLKNIVANYTATQSYDLTKTGSYPIQCFTYSTFITYLTYDNSGNIPFYNYNVGDNKMVSIEAPTSIPSGVPLFSSLHNYQGFLYVELTNVVAPSQINFYVELGRKEGNIPDNSKPDYYYLGAMGWLPLSILSDGTNNFSCSGIITFSMPKDSSNQSTIMNSKNYWICIATKNDVLNYPDITFLKTNGVMLTRSDSEYQFDTTEPKIDSAVISKSTATIPEIESIIQPFPSFGGKAMEDDSTKNKRVSNRLKTKDRIASTSDYYRLIQEEFNDIYFSKTIYSNKKAQVYIVKKYNSATDFNAFVPMVTVCKEEKIQKYLAAKTSAFTIVTVSNFSFIYVTINATVTLYDGYEFQGVQKILETALNLFLSPWITTDCQQIDIDVPLVNIEVINFMRTIEGISNVENFTFSTTQIDGSTKVVTDNLTTIVLDPNAGLIIVSNMNHNINERS
jgi:hypothetical protein